VQDEIMDQVQEYLKNLAIRLYRFPQGIHSKYKRNQMSNQSYIDMIRKENKQAMTNELNSTERTEDDNLKYENLTQSR